MRVLGMVYSWLWDIFQLRCSQIKVKSRSAVFATTLSTIAVRYAFWEAHNRGNSIVTLTIYTVFIETMSSYPGDISLP